MRFSEKDFYLAEFRARTIGIALSDEPGDQAVPLAAVVEELRLNATRAVLLTPSAELPAAFGAVPTLAASGPRWMGELWRTLANSPRAAIVIPQADPFAERVGEIARDLGLVKLVWIDRGGGLTRPGGGRRSFVELCELDDLIAAGVEADRQELLREIRAMVMAGVPAVNLCTAAGLADELFSYAGSGTLFTREGYTHVRALALDEFGAAFDLVGRGVEEGYLVPRSDDELDRVLSNAFGVFVEGRHLAGIGALLPSGEGRVGEIASLYTLTRFLGDGVGGHLVGFALARARQRGYEYVYATTTSPRVQAFFERHGFATVAPSALPDEKWKGYSEERMARVLCLRHDLGPRSD